MSSPLATFRAGDHDWEADPDQAAFVREVLVPQVEHPEALPGAETIKHNRARTVVRVAGPAGRIYLKRYRVRSLGARLLSLLRASPARREWRALRALAAAAIPVPRPLLLGEARRGLLLTGCVLGTAEAVGYQEVVRVLDERRAAGPTALDPSGGRQGLCERLAPLVAGLLRAGADHLDLHLGNFLVHPDGPLLALDLHSVRLRRGAVPARTRRARLARLAHSFGVCDPVAGPAAREELAWFCAAYAAADPGLGSAAALRERLLVGARAVEARRLKSRDKRCLVSSTSYVAHGPRGRRVYRRREVTPQWVWTALDTKPAAVVHAHPRGRSRIETLPTPPGAGEELGPFLVRKLYLFPSWRARLAGALAPTLAMRAWRAARACEVRGIPHPRHYALVAEGVLPRLATILMERIADATMVHVWLEAGQATPAARFELARALGQLVGRFHASGLKHRDLALQNLLVRARADQAGGGDGAAGWDAWVIDLDEVRTGRMSPKEKLRALSQLADLPAQATRTDRARFFRAYLQAGGDEVLAPELAAWGARGLGRRVGVLLAEKARKKALRLAAGIARPAPTDVGALRS